jgi:cytochrome c oxidase assembly protein subunit 15
VLLMLPPAVSIGHAGLAQLFFALTVSLVLFTSRGWIVPPRPPVEDDGLRRRAIALSIVIYVQILLGATMRHLEAGLAIPDFPLAFGHVLPPVWTWPIAIHFAHRVGALVVTIFAIANVAALWHRFRGRPELIRAAAFFVAAIGTQVTLGAFIIWTAKNPIVNTLHVATGALVFVTSIVISLRLSQAKLPRLVLPS